MQTSSSGIALIKNAEGERLTAYLCPAGILTIGVGHTGPDVKRGQTITPAQSAALLASDLAKFEAGVASHVKVPMTQNMFDALVALSFNIGMAAFSGSTLLSLLNAGHKEEAAAQFARWVKAKGVTLPGLVARRAAEAALFVKP